MRAWYTLGGVLVLSVAAIVSCGSDDPAPVDPDPPAPGGDAAPPDAAGEPADAGPDAPPPDAPDAATDGYVDPAGKSGTRLRRRYVEAGPGAYRTLDFWDSELGVPCEFQTAADGELRCLPQVIMGDNYADPGCEERVVLTGRCAPTYVREGGGVYRRTTKRTTTRYYMRAAACHEEDAGPGEEVWNVEPVPAASFVRGTTEDEPRAGGLAARFVVGDDGSRLLVSVRDTGRNAACEPTVDGRCLPSSRSWSSGLFSDSSCTAPVSAVSSGVAPALLEETTQLPNGCAGPSSYFSVGAPLASGEGVFQRNAGTCVEGTRNPSTTYYRRGAPVPLSALPATKTALEGTGGVRARRYVDLDGQPLGQARALWDAGRDVACRPYLFPDGKYRCVPEGSATTLRYADVGCSATPLGELSVCREPGAFLARAGDESCDVRQLYHIHEIYERGVAYEGPVYEIRGYCAELPPSYVDKYRYFRVGPLVPPSQFPELTVKTE